MPRPKTRKPAAHQNGGDAAGHGMDGTQRQSSCCDEGVLYTVQVTKRPPRKPSTFARFKAKFSAKKSATETANAIEPGAKRNSRGGKDTPQAAPRSDTLFGAPSEFAQPNENNTSRVRQQYTISKFQSFDTPTQKWLYTNFGIDISKNDDVDSHLYSPSKYLFYYINWTFYSRFFLVFLSFLVIFIVLCVVFAGMLLAAGKAKPECIVVSGQPFGQFKETQFSDAFALSWTTFTTVGYGNTYTSTGGDFGEEEPHACGVVVFLCTLEAFLGLLYAGMCAAIMFGKVNRVQSHAHLQFCNAVCLQYEDTNSDSFVGDDTNSDSDSDDGSIVTEEDEGKAEFKKNYKNKDLKSSFVRREKAQERFVEHYKGCPIIKFQVSNLHCNKEGGEMIDAMMKVIGIKNKKRDGKITHSQYVRVNLVDCEHPFFGRIWHGTHILNENSPLLTNSARLRIEENGGSWPKNWYNPDVIRKKLDFQNLIVTVAGISNISAITVHAYKRYKIGDILIGFDFAPLVYENEDTGKLEVDLSLINDVREQRSGGGEDLRNSQTSINKSDGSLSGSFVGKSTMKIITEEYSPDVSKRRSIG